MKTIACESSTKQKFDKAKRQLENEKDLSFNQDEVLSYLLDLYLVPQNSSPVAG